METSTFKADLKVETGNALPNVPKEEVRLKGFLVKIDRAWIWLDGKIQKLCPAELNPLANSGRTANFALIQAVISGVLMLLWYSPSVQFAYPSLAELGGHSLGGIVRAAHRYSSDILMLLLFVHASRMLFARKFTGARWLPWVSGIGLIALIWFIGWTGYWLVWDQPAQQVALTSVKLLDTLPVWAEPLGRSFLTNRLVPSLLFFVIFFLHMLLPLGIAIGLVVHLLRLSRVKLLPDRRLCIAMTAALILVATIMPAPLDEAADMAVKAEEFTVDAWYMTPLALGLRFQQPGLWMAIFGTLGLCMGIPWILGRRRKADTFQAEVEVSRCHSCSQCVNDCPFDAVSLVPRTDGKPFPSQAWVDPAKCVGCGVCNGSCDSAGIGLTWFNSLIEEERILTSFARAIEDGASPWIAFVPGDLEGGPAQLNVGRWKSHLAGFHVERVPTASWVRASLVEQLLKDHAKGVLVVRDARVEAQARDGNQWVGDRLQGIRGPEFRAKRANSRENWKIIDYNASDLEGLKQEAEAFCSPQASSQPDGKPVALWKGLLACVILCVGLGAAAIAPSHLTVSNPTPSDPEIIFAFKALGELEQPGAVPTEEDLSKPIHMRGRSTEKPRRAPVTLRITINGVVEEKSFTARGVSNDGPSIGEWRQHVQPGRHAVSIELLSGNQVEPITWTGKVDAEARRLHVITYTPQDGFRVE